MGIQFTSVLVLFVFSLSASAAEYLLRSPAVSKTQIVFEYADDLWTVPRAGGEASRLTTGPGTESSARFSPDGSMLAFSGEYDGNIDVFVIPASGGVPKRLTWHPGGDDVQGWTPDGKRVLFMNQGSTHNGAGRLYTVDLDGGLPQEIPLPTAAMGSYSPDGSQLAYVPWFRRDRIWKRYRGGTATPIWIAQMSDSSITKIPRVDSNDHSPMWIGNKVYFLSDRSSRYSLYSYDPASRKVSLAFDNKELDIKAASAGPDVIAMEQFGEIKLYHLKGGKVEDVKITLAGGDLLSVRPRLQKVDRFIQWAGISPSGVRAVFSARGEVLTVPAEKGDVRNLTNTTGFAERDAAWSPDGQSIAYFSDESGEYELHIRPQNGQGDVRKLRLEEKPSFYYRPVWSPDSKKIAYSDKRNNLWYVDLDAKTPVKVDSGYYYGNFFEYNARWSPDSQWISFTRIGKNKMGVIHLFSLKDQKSYPVTDGMSDAGEAVFDKGGKYLFFAASTDAGPAINGLDMSTNARPVTLSLYAVVLSKDDPSPFAPESDEEKAADEKKPDEKKTEEKKAEEKKADAKKPTETKIDIADIGQRIVPLPVPPRRYRSLEAGKAGTLFYIESPLLQTPSTFVPNSSILHKFDMAKRKAEKFLDGMGSFVVSANGEKMLTLQGQRWAIVGTGAPPKPGTGTIKTGDMEVSVDPRAEWAQMYREVWRIERDFFYDASLHGVNVADYSTKYQKYLERIGSRRDLNYLFGEMLGELTVGHLYIQGGDTSVDNPKKVNVGLLGADYKLENGRYRFQRVYSGESWNPKTRAPLTQPGVNVKAGEYLLAVRGRELKDTDNLYAAFEATAGKSVLIRVGPNPTLEGSREVTVVPVDGEVPLRTLAWMEDNRRHVDRASGGKLAYVHMPDTGFNGYEYFNRYYFSQTDKDGVIIDERWNRGGQAADYVIDTLRRKLWNYWTTRDGADSTTPGLAIFGPKVMIANEHSGSGGDLMPWLFKRAQLGPVVGTRTWGGLVGIGGYPQLMDGGRVTAPHFAFYSPDGKWDVENHGTDPDVPVELDPKAWRQGKDTQLEKAIEVAMTELKKNPPPASKKPAFPNYHRPAAAPPPVSGSGQD